MARIINVLRIQGPPERVMEVWERIKDPHAGLGSVDFNAITPMPEWVDRGVLDRDTEEKNSPENCWLQWSRDNWGCEWNALDPQESARLYDGGDCIRFFTEDVPVQELIRKLSRMEPDLYLDYLWACEDVDRGAAAVQFLDGNVTMIYVPTPGTGRAYQLAFDILQEAPEQYGYSVDAVTGEYVWRGGTAGGRAEH